MLDEDELRLYSDFIEQREFARINNFRDYSKFLRAAKKKPFNESVTEIFKSQDFQPRYDKQRNKFFRKQHKALADRFKSEGKDVYSKRDWKPVKEYWDTLRKPQ